LCNALGLEPLLAEPRFADNPRRVENRDALDAIIGGAVAALTLEELRERLERHEVGFSPIQDIADVFANPHLAAREAIVTVRDPELGAVRMQGVVPRFSDTPGRVRAAGPGLGQHTEDVCRELGISSEAVAQLRAAKVL